MIVNTMPQSLNKERSGDINFDFNNSEDTFIEL